MTTVINAHPTRQEARPEPGSQMIGCLVAIALIAFGLWIGASKTIEFAAGALRDQDAIDAAEMQMLQDSMNCEPGEMLEIRPLGDHGAKSVKCIAGDNMPPVRRQPVEGGQRG
jgi:hypothetical protein